MTAYLSDVYYLVGRDNDAIQRERDELLSSSLSDLNTLGESLKPCTQNAAYCTVGNAENIENNKDLYDEIIKVNLSLYDTDGLEGLYVPSSSFRETARDVASGAVGSSMSINQGSYGNSLSQWGMQAVQNAYQRTTSAVGKVIRKNTAHLKYGTFVYLVNGNQTRTE